MDELRVKKCFDRVGKPWSGAQEEGSGIACIFQSDTRGWGRLNFQKRLVKTRQHRPFRKVTYSVFGTEQWEVQVPREIMRGPAAKFNVRAFRVVYSNRWVWPLHRPCQLALSALSLFYFCIHILAMFVAC